MEVESEKVVLPSGKEVKLLDALSFCYDISDTEYKVLQAVLDKKTITEDELVESLKLSKASINRSLNKLVSLGFISREKLQSSKGGRPKYVYRSVENQILIERIREDFEKCSQMFINILPKVLLSSLGS
ncbi:HTH-type transcriptional regulator Lrs14 [Stygiolobus caldivivus]|uniref:TrmB family transcriptional regulator n=1 Tax=Stygiolobus caldivivus TaxID=2824673 RepID=A0A8D5U562_9CREN|nr:HTH-type transcriptional regulator Lrs14 [Stygiolobus caldivivus]BCU69129.1 TrmB family transcriptional regulator [Stygiolobus caldivivus]